MLFPENRGKGNAKSLNDGLMHRVAGGDRAAFEQLYCATQDAVYCYVLSIVKSKATAEDLMQDTYLSIRKSIQHYVPQGKPLAWIFTIARNLAYMELRRNQRQETEDLSEQEEKLGVDEISKSIDGIILKKALEILNERERHVVLLHVSQGFKFREIAGLLSLPVGTVLSCYNRAIKKLYKAINDEEC